MSYPEPVKAYETNPTITRTTPCYTDNESETITYSYDTENITGVVFQCEPTFSMTLPTFDNSHVGNYTITINGSDPHSTAEEHSMFTFTLEVEANVAPVNNSGRADDNMYAYATGTDAEFIMPTDFFTDADGDPLTYHLTTVPASSIFTYDDVNDELLVSATTNSDVGVYNITIVADDTHALTANDSSSFLFEVLENEPPAINATLTDVSYYGSRTSYYDAGIGFEDALSETITYDITVPTNATSFISINSATGNITIAELANDKEGNYSITVHARDINYPSNGERTQTFTIELLNNLGPTTTEVLSDITLVALYDMDVDWSAGDITDREGDPINWEILNNFTDDSWTTFSYSNVQLTGAPPNTEVGTNEVTLRTFDDKGQENFYPILVIVTINHVPELNTTTNFTIDLQCHHAFSIDMRDFFFDQNSGEVLEYEVLTSPSPAIPISNTTHLMTTTKSCNVNTTYTVGVRAHDPKGQTVDADILLASIIDEPPFLNDTIDFIT